MLQSVKPTECLEGWAVQLYKLYPDELNYPELPQQYLRELLDRSTSPVALLGWKSQFDLEGSSADDQSDGIHNALVWKTAKNNIKYLSFQPDKKAQKSFPGRLCTFLNDLSAQNRLPDLVAANLSETNHARLCGQKILKWQPSTLTELFKQLQKSPPVFDNQAKKHGKCAMMIANLLIEACELNDASSLKWAIDVCKKDHTYLGSPSLAKKVVLFGTRLIAEAFDQSSNCENGLLLPVLISGTDIRTLNQVLE